MKCVLYKTCFGLLSCLVFSFLFFSSNSFAIEDLTATYTTSDVSLNSSTGLFGNSDCSQFNSVDHKYLVINSVFVPNESTTNLELYLYSGNSIFRLPFRPYATDYILFDLSNYQAWDGFHCVALYSTFYIRDTITFILTDHLPSSGITPSGSLSITENGTYDVTNYAEAVVDVPESSLSGGDYHDDLVAINNSILICAATCLVLYFFYCIYRMIIKSTGGF